MDGDGDSMWGHQKSIECLNSKAIDFASKSTKLIPKLNDAIKDVELTSYVVSGPVLAEAGMASGPMCTASVGMALGPVLAQKLEQCKATLEESCEVALRSVFEIVVLFEQTLESGTKDDALSAAVKELLTTKPGAGTEGLQSFTEEKKELLRILQDIRGAIFVFLGEITKLSGTHMRKMEQVLSNYPNTWPLLAFSNVITLEVEIEKISEGLPQKELERVFGEFQDSLNEKSSEFGETIRKNISYWLKKEKD